MLDYLGAKTDITYVVHLIPLLGENRCPSAPCATI
jgi:hypothetical protein